MPCSNPWCVQVCYALSQLALGFGSDASTAHGTSPLSPYFKDIIQALLETVRQHATLLSLATTTVPHFSQAAIKIFAAARTLLNRSHAA